MNTNSYHAAHQSLAFFDASKTFGRVAAKGPDAIDLLHRMSTNDLTPLIGKEGVGAQTVLTTEKGRIIDLLQVLSLANEGLLVTSGGQVIRMNTGDMRPIGRDTQGVRLIDLAEGDRVVSIASLSEPESEEAPEAEVPEEQGD